MDHSNPVETLHSMYMTYNPMGGLSIIRLCAFIRSMMNQNYMARFKNVYHDYRDKLDWKLTNIERGIKRNKCKRSPFAQGSLELFRLRNRQKHGLRQYQFDKTLNPGSCQRYAIYLNWFISTTTTHHSVINYIIPGLINKRSKGGLYLL